VVVWSLPLPAGSEGPSLIPHAARLLSVGHPGLLPAPSWRTIIGEPNQPCVPLETWSDVALEPEVEHVVKVYVAEHRGDARPLCGSLFRPTELLAVEDTHIQTLADQPQERRISHPDLE